MERAVGGNTRLLDQLIRILRATSGDDLLLDAERCCLFQNKRELFNGSRHHDRIEIRCLNFRQLRAHILSGLIHGFDETDADVIDLEDLSEIFGRATLPSRC